MALTEKVIKAKFDCTIICRTLPNFWFVKEKQVDDQDQKPAASKDPVKAVTHEQDSKDSNTKLKCILKNVEPSKQAEYELHIKAAGPKIAALMGVLQGNDLSKPQVLKAE